VQETGAADHHTTRNGEILIKFKNEGQFKSEAKVLACPCVTNIMVGNRKKINEKKSNCSSSIYSSGL
jgi:hypothetical protein